MDLKDGLFFVGMRLKPRKAPRFWIRRTTSVSERVMEKLNTIPLEFSTMTFDSEKISNIAGDKFNPGDIVTNTIDANKVIFINARRSGKTLQEKDYEGYSENFDDLIKDGNYVDETKGKRGIQNKEKKRTASRKANKKASKQRKKNGC